MKHVVQDDFFDDPDLVRKIGLELYQAYRTGLDIQAPFGWRGHRSIPLRYVPGEHHDFLQEMTNKVLNYVWDSLDLKNYEYPYLNGYDGVNTDGGNTQDIARRKIEEPHITSYYHVLPNQALTSLPDFHQDKFHKDDLPCAGLVYLSPDPPEGSGTAILDGERNQFDIVDNKYNRLVCYDGYRIHGPCNTFGIDLETGRMSFTFFIHEVKLTGELE